MNCDQRRPEQGLADVRKFVPVHRRAEQIVEPVIPGNASLDLLTCTQLLDLLVRPDTERKRIHVDEMHVHEHLPDSSQDARVLEVRIDLEASDLFFLAQSIDFFGRGTLFLHPVQPGLARRRDVITALDQVLVTCCRQKRGELPMVDRQAPEALEGVVDSFRIDLVDRSGAKLLRPELSRKPSPAEALLLELLAGGAVPFLRAGEVVLVAQGSSGQRTGRWPRAT